jgi:hypothetical protein
MIITIILEREGCERTGKDVQYRESVAIRSAEWRFLHASRVLNAVFALSPWRALRCLSEPT